jgi:hypothetical protein
VSLSDDLLIKHLLRLGEDARLVGAQVRNNTLVLSVDFPQAPEGADEAEPMYVRATEDPDPVQVLGIRWKRRGEVIATDSRAPHPLLAEPEKA